MSFDDASGEELNEEEQSSLDRARTACARAAHEAMAAYDGARLVTGYVLIVEAIEQDGRARCYWFSGTGQEPEGTDEGGLPAHRLEGMVRAPLRNMYRGDTSSA